MELRDIAILTTAFVAIGTLLFTIYSHSVSRRDKQTQLFTSIKNGFLTFGPELSDTMLLIEIANRDDKPIKIKGIGILAKKNFIFFPRGIEGTATLPFQLEPGDGETFWTPLKEFAESLHREGYKGKTKIRSSVNTATGEQFTSKPFKIDIDGWIAD